MVDLFPSLLDFAPLGPTILRLIVGIIFVDIGYVSMIRKESSWGLLLQLMGFNHENSWRKVLGSVEFIGGILLILGLYTQIAAIVLVFITLFKLLVEYKEPSFVKRDFTFYLMLFIITLSLIVTGPGAYSFGLLF